MPLLLEISTEQLYNFYKDSMSEMEFYKIMGSDSKRTPVKGALLDAVKNKAISIDDAIDISYDYDNLEATQKQEFNVILKKENINMNDINSVIDRLKKYIGNREETKDKGFTMIDKETMLLYEDDTWYIISPLSPESSRKHCSKSHWCTASASYEHYFPMYTINKKACLISFFNKKDEENSFQIAIDINKEVNNQCDFADNLVSDEWVINQVGQELYDKVTSPEILEFAIKKTNQDTKIKKNYLERLPFSSLMRLSSNVFFVNVDVNTMDELRNYGIRTVRVGEFNDEYFFIYSSRHNKGMVFSKKNGFLTNLPFINVISIGVPSVNFLGIVKCLDNKFNILNKDGSLFFKDNAEELVSRPNYSIGFFVFNDDKIVELKGNDIIEHNDLVFKDGKIYAQLLAEYNEKLGCFIGKRTCLSHNEYSTVVLGIDKDNLIPINDILTSLYVSYKEYEEIIKKYFYAFYESEINGESFEFSDRLKFRFETTKFKEIFTVASRISNRINYLLFVHEDNKCVDILSTAAYAIHIETDGIGNAIMAFVDDTLKGYRAYIIFCNANGHIRRNVVKSMFHIYIANDTKNLTISITEHNKIASVYRYKDGVVSKEKWPCYLGYIYKGEYKTDVLGNKYFEGKSEMYNEYTINTFIISEDGEVTTYSEMRGDKGLFDGGVLLSPNIYLRRQRDSIQLIDISSDKILLETKPFCYEYYFVDENEIMFKSYNSDSGINYLIDKDLNIKILSKIENVKTWFAYYSDEIPFEERSGRYGECITLNDGNDKNGYFYYSSNRHTDRLPMLIKDCYHSFAENVKLSDTLERQVRIFFLNLLKKVEKEINYNDTGNTESENNIQEAKRITNKIK